jgi:hypothetical protein
MIDSQYIFKIQKNQDVENAKSDLFKVNILKLELQNQKLSMEKFLELFEVLAEVKLTEFYLNLSNLTLDDTQVNAICAALSNWNLRVLEINVNNVSLTEYQFDKIFHDALVEMVNLESFAINAEGTKMNATKIKSLEKLIDRLPNLDSVKFNFKNNGLATSDIADLSKMMNLFSSRDILF